MKHAITLEQAKKMTAEYRNQKEIILKEEYNGKDILSISETFDAESIRSLLSQEGCQSIRFYFGMNENLQIRIICVAVSENGEMLDGQDSIMEEGTVCPPVCPPLSSSPSLAH